MLDVADVFSNTIRVSDVPSVDVGGTSWVNQKVVIQRVPQYTNVTISGVGNITASVYDRLVTEPTGAAGYNTGIVAILVSGTLNIYGSIDVDGKGYKGGPEARDGAVNYGWAGERTGGYSTSYESTYDYKAEGGGGAGYYPASSGGGGGHGTAGSNGSKNPVESNARGGIGAPIFGSAAMSRMTFGGGGGTGGQFNNNRYGAAGGHGGGIIYINARNINSFGSITANGEDGATGIYAYDDNSGGAGGGGAGGSVYIRVFYLYGSGSSVIAEKGDGGSGVGSRGQDGGNGGDGIIRIDYTKVNDLNYPNDTNINSIADPDPYTSRLPEGWYYFSGYTQLSGFNIGPRIIYVYRRDTGEYMGTTTSSGNGTFTILTTYSGSHFVVALDDIAEPDYNDKIVGNVIPYYHE